MSFESPLIRVTLVIPNFAMRAGLSVVLEAAAFRIAISSIATGLDIPHPTDVLIVTDGVAPQALQQALAAGPAEGCALLLLADRPSALQAYRQLSVSAWGLLPMDTTAEEIVAAVYALSAGLVVMPPEWVEATPQVRQVSSSAGEADPLVEPLTAREAEVLQCLAEGLSNKQIALRLQISEHTVKFHISSIYSKLGAANRAEAVRLGVQRGWVLV